ncbi:hypothetical protein AVEN_81432-1 [Araneus ventricosus]|uniref:Uncharacterized protein n=1 Tax=Araneus ventricosus TaxID=182803 RepID=A0A4Y2MR55_ARAVE|nr:hypothetical protein AVEN_81432-1 [Araneus ventricosus]
MNWTLPTWVVIYPNTPPPAITFPQGAGKWAVVGKDNLTTHTAISEPHLPSKEGNHLRSALIAVKGKFVDRLARCERTKVLQTCVVDVAYHFPLSYLP